MRYETGDGKLVNFKLTNYQNSLIEKISLTNTIEICKGRATGVSTLFCLYIIWESIFNNNNNILFISHNFMAKKEMMFKICRLMKHMKGQINTISIDDHSIKFLNNSIIQFVGYQNLEYMRGKSFNEIILDEIKDSNAKIDYLPYILDTKGKVIRSWSV